MATTQKSPRAITETGTGSDAFGGLKGTASLGSPISFEQALTLLKDGKKVAPENFFTEGKTRTWLESFDAGGKQVIIVVSLGSVQVFQSLQDGIFGNYYEVTDANNANK